MKPLPHRFRVFNLVSGGALLLASVIAGALWSTSGPSATRASPRGEAPGVRRHRLTTGRGAPAPSRRRRASAWTR